VAVTSRFAGANGADVDGADVDGADVNDSDDISFTLSLSIVILFDVHQSVICDTLQDR
jgi:hypothetical protein